MRCLNTSRIKTNSPLGKTVTCTCCFPTPLYPLFNLFQFSSALWCLWHKNTIVRGPVNLLAYGFQPVNHCMRWAVLCWLYQWTICSAVYHYMLQFKRQNKVTETQVLFPPRLHAVSPPSIPCCCFIFYAFNTYNAEAFLSKNKQRWRTGGYEWWENVVPLLFEASVL